MVPRHALGMWNAHSMMVGFRRCYGLQGGPGRPMLLKSSPWNLTLPVLDQLQQMVSSCLLNLEETGMFFGSSITVLRSVGFCLYGFLHQPLALVCIRKLTSSDLLDPAAHRPCLPHSCLRQPELQGQIPGAALEIYPPAAFSLKMLRLIFSREFREKLLWFLCIVYFSGTCWTFSRDSSPALRVNIYSLLFEVKDESPTTLSAQHLQVVWRCWRFLVP